MINTYRPLGNVSSTLYIF